MNLEDQSAFAVDYLLDTAPAQVVVRFLIDFPDETDANRLINDFLGSIHNRRIDSSEFTEELTRLLLAAHAKYKDWASITAAVKLVRLSPVAPAYSDDVLSALLATENPFRFKEITKESIFDLQNSQLSSLNPGWDNRARKHFSDSEVIDAVIESYKRENPALCTKRTA